MEKTDLIFGTRAVIEAILAGKEFEKILIRRDLDNALARDLFDAIRSTSIPVKKVPPEALNRLTQKNHQGVIGYVTPIIYQNIENIIPTLYENGKIPFIVVLDGVTDVRNFGAIARTAEVAGVDAILVPTAGTATINADAIKTSAGALFNIPVCRTSNLAATVKYLKDSGLKIIAASEKAKTNYFDTNLSGPIALVMGAEDTGIAPEILRTCDVMVAIPVFGAIKSLNVSVATGVLAFDIVRQRANEQ